MTELLQIIIACVGFFVAASFFTLSLYIFKCNPDVWELNRKILKDINNPKYDNFVKRTLTFSNKEGKIIVKSKLNDESIDRVLKP